MIRDYINRQYLFSELVDEAATGRRRQRANASKPRPDYLQRVIIKLVTANEKIRIGGLTEELKRLATLAIDDPDRRKARIERVDEGDDVIEWRDPPKTPAGSAQLSQLKHRLRNARKAAREVKKSL